MRYEDAPLISVVVPVYNSEKYLHQCLDSIVGQQYTKLEIILVDDDSSDSSGLICDQYAEKDNRITVIHSGKIGLVRARKIGLLASHGDYISHIDSDDWIDSDMYLNMYQGGMCHQVDLVVTEYIREMANGTQIKEAINIRSGIYQRGEIHEQIWPLVADASEFFKGGASLAVWRHLYKRELAIANQLRVDDCISIGEDIAIVMPCYFTMKSFAVVTGYHYHYRLHKGSYRRKIRKNEVESAKVLFRYLLDRADEANIKALMEKKIVHYTYFILLYSSLYIFVDDKQNTMQIYDIKRGNSVVIYGAGVLGEEMYRCFKDTDFCKIVAWVDSNSSIYGDEVCSPEILDNIEYDCVILAIANPYSRKKVKEKLMKKGIECKKIADINNDILTLEILQKYLFLK